MGRSVVKRTAVVVVVLALLLVTFKAALAAGVRVSGGPLLVNKQADPLLSFSATNTDGYGGVVPAARARADIANLQGVVVLSINGVEAGSGSFLFSKDVSALPSGEYDVSVGLDGYRTVVPLVITSYPAALGVFYEGGVVSKGRVVVAFIVLGVVAVLALVWLVLTLRGGVR